jgi:sugar (pentulose or hexulose) kinase
VTPGVAVMSLGTSGTVFGHATAPAIDPLREVSAFCDSTGGWLPLACVLNCTLPLEWARALFGLDQARFDALVSGVPAGARGLTFVPYLDGERTPNRPDASGELLGLRTHHGPAEVSRAVLEGVTAGLAHAVRAFRRTGTAADELLLVGGAARSEVWGQLLADWLDLPIARPSVAEAAARGAAIQAAHVVGGAPLHRPIATDARWEPRAGTGVAEVAAAYAAR